MEVRPVTLADLDAVREIDGTIHSPGYLHVDQSGEGLSLSWKLTERPLREARAVQNRLSDDVAFVLKQIAGGAEDGLTLLAEHDSQPAALMVAQADNSFGTLIIRELRVDFDFRRQGLATAMLFHSITTAREQEIRAVSVETLTNNIPAARLLSKCGFEVAGIDVKRRSNHDLVKELATLFWYAALD